MIDFIHEFTHDTKKRYHFPTLGKTFHMFVHFNYD